MPASRRTRLLLVGLLTVAWAAAVSVTVTAFRPPPPENPTCRQLRDDASVRRHTVVKVTREFDPPPHVARRELAATVRSALADACAGPGNDTGREGRRRPLGADLRGTLTRRLRELEARRR